MFSFNPIKGLIEGLQRFKEDFDFFDLNATLEILKNRWKNGTLNTPEVDLDEAVILLCKSFSSNIKQKNSQWTKLKWVQNHNKCTVEGYIFLRKNVMKTSVNFFYK